MPSQNDWLRDDWVESNCPKTDVFTRDIVKHFMKAAYEQGRLRESRQRNLDERERLHGPDFI